MAPRSAAQPYPEPPEKSEAEIEAEMLAASQRIDRVAEDESKARIRKLSVKEKAAKLAAKKAEAKARRPPPRIPGPGKRGWKTLQTVEWPPGVDPHSLDLKNATYYKHPDVDLIPPCGYMPIHEFEKAKWERDKKLAAERGEPLPDEPASLKPLTAADRAHLDAYAEARVAGKTEAEARSLANEAKARAELEAAQGDQSSQSSQGDAPQLASNSGETPDPQTAPAAAPRTAPGRKAPPGVDLSLADAEFTPGLTPEEIHARVMARLALGRTMFPNNYLGFLAFYQLMTAERGFGMPKHLEHVGMALMDDRIKNLLIIIGPGAGKSSMLSTLYPAFAIGQNPALTVLGISAGESLMQGFQSTVMEWIESHPGYQQAFPGVRPDKDRGWSTDRGLFVKGHAQGDPDASYFAVGLTSKALTGKHARVIIGDDLHDKENSASAEACLRVRETYYRQIIGRADPRGARFIFAGRRWHEEDIYGHLKSTGEWVVMELPAVRKGSKQLYWDITIPEGLHCCFNEPVQRTSILGDAGAAAAKAAETNT